jgi:hypothetical protein
MPSSHVRSAVAKLERSSSSSISLSSHIGRYQEKIGNGSVRSRNTSTTVDLDESRTSVTFDSDVRRSLGEPFCGDDSWSCMTECSFANESIHLDALFVTCGTHAREDTEGDFEELRRNSTRTCTGSSQNLRASSSKITGLKTSFEQKSRESTKLRQGRTNDDFYSRAYRSCSDIQFETARPTEGSRRPLRSPPVVKNLASQTITTHRLKIARDGPDTKCVTNASKDGAKRSVPLQGTWLRRSESTREVSTPIDEMVTSLLPSYESQLDELRRRGRKQPIKLFD